MSLPNCPKCNSEYTYEDMELIICPECFFEFTMADLERKKQEEEERNAVRDSNGNLLSDGDSVSIIKDLKVKGASGPLKMGTVVKDIKLVDPLMIKDDHNISCKIPGFGPMDLKSEFVKKI